MSSIVMHVEAFGDYGCLMAHCVIVLSSKYQKFQIFVPGNVLLVVNL